VRQKMMRPMNVLSEGSSFLPPGCSFEIQLEVLKNDPKVYSYPRVHELELETTVRKKGPGLGLLTSLLPRLTLNMWE